jgi:hypothetical protein
MSEQVLPQIDRKKVRERIVAYLSLPVVNGVDIVMAHDLMECLYYDYHRLNPPMPSMRWVYNRYRKEGRE